ncbi:thiaminase II [Haloparvum sedimenti]|uniref:thiaminase II n=1 Tax=Haloparvum sedimenti TaxID=1678448 RepID=UPI00071E8901|nr:thiaminase II [Haloparvum sedimenti]
MAFSDELLDAGSDLWAAQKRHPFVVELAEGTLDEDAFLTWVRQDYRYLLDYARTFAVGGTKVRDEETMTHLLGVAHRVLDDELDLHRSFAAEYGIDRAELERVEKAPTCVAYTNYLLRTAESRSVPEFAAAIYPCGQGYLDVAEHMTEIADGEHRYTPFIEKYTSDEFREAVDWMRAFVDRCGAAYPGYHDAMREAFLTSARLEHAFWEMAYTAEDWGTATPAAAGISSS